MSGYRSAGKRPWPSSLLAAVLLASGCFKAGPEFVSPPAPVSDAWIEGSDPRVKTSPDGYRNWWQAFKDPVLDKLIERACRENLSLRIAGVRILEARAQLGIAWGEIFPQTQQATGTLQYNKPSEDYPLGNTGGTAYWLAEVGVSASWELDFWGKFRRAIESANAGWLASVANYDSALVTLTADVATAYIAVRTFEKRIGIARRNVETQKESLKIAEARYEDGTVSRLDVEQARTLLYASEASIHALETKLRQAKNSLCVLLGLPPGDLADLLGGAAEIPVAPPAVAVGIPADLLRRRPDIRSAELQAAAQCALIGVAKADLYPAFSLTGSFGFLSTDIGKSSLSDLFRWDSRTVQAGPSVRWDFLNYGRIENDVRVQDARFQELLIAYQNAVLTAQKEVEDSLSAFLNDQDQVTLLGQSATAARAALDLAVFQYREGTVDFTTVLAAQLSLLVQEDNLAGTQGNVSTDLVGVYRALGGGWEIREEMDPVPPAIRDEMKERTDWGGLLEPAQSDPAPPQAREAISRVSDG